MSYAPQTLLDLRWYLKAQMGLSDNELGIVGDSNHTYGYHLGRDRLGTNDYSARLLRDRNGLSNAASASDIGMFPRLVELTAFLVTQASSGGTTMIREIIGPGSDGRAYDWDSQNGWNPSLRSKGDAHEWHCHISWFRDTEFEEKISLFRKFFEGETDMSFEQPDRNVGWATTNRAYTLLANEAESVFQVEGEAGPRHEVNGLKVQLDRIEAKLDKLLAGPVTSFEGAEFIMTGKVTHTS